MRILFLGDSITEGSGASDPQKFGYVSVFANLTGHECLNYGVGGTRIAKQTVPSAWLTSDQYFYTRALIMPDQADLVFVFGGTNDYCHGDAKLGNIHDDTDYTFYGALNNLLTYLINKYGKEKIRIVLPIHRFDEDVWKTSLWDAKKEGYTYFEKYCRVIQEVSDKFGIKVYDIRENFGIVDPKNITGNPNISPDGLHPSNIGHKTIAKALIKLEFGE